jgi:BirA family transcriptional regulator, biotin operon repressor / biotin---[acetyl-CoA-carboxylase] ligase
MMLTDLSNPFESAPIYYKEKTGSTMNDIKTLDPSIHGSVVFTGFQETGRGRLAGRQWASDQGKNLLFTLQLDIGTLVHPPFQIPLLTGLGIAEFLKRQYSLDAEIKWPNDVLVGGKKICGILCEAGGSRVYVGIGLNCLQRDFSEAFRHKSTSISLLSHRDCAPRFVLPRLLSSLKECYLLSSWRDRILPLLHRLGDIIYLAEGIAEKEDAVPVKVTGLSDEGFLLVEDIRTGEIKTVVAGELLFPGYNTN